MRKYWDEEFSQAWTKRNINNINVNARELIFKEILDGLNIHNILEIGCNIGYNMIALMKLKYKVWGIDNLQYNIDNTLPEIKGKISLGDCRHLPNMIGSYDLVMLCGLLNCLSYDDVDMTIQEAYIHASKYVLIIDHYIVGDIYPEGEYEIEVKNDNGLLYICRDYKNKLPNMIKYIEQLPESFGKGFQMSAFLFEKRVQYEILSHWYWACR
jgi:hypothetical protein